MKQLIVLSLLILLAAGCSSERDREEAADKKAAEAMMLAEEAKAEMLKLCLEIPAKEERLGQELASVSQSKTLTDRQDHQQYVNQLQSELAVMRPRLKKLEEQIRRFDLQEKTFQEQVRQGAIDKATKESFNKLVDRMKKDDQLGTSLDMAVNDWARATSATLGR